MRKLLLVPATALLAGVAGASEMRDNVGVGLGTMLWEPAGDGLLSQICAATTNASFGNQTFAITSGTSNAKKPSNITSNKLYREFIHDNMDKLARDISTGSGETLEALAEIAAIPQDKRDSFARTLQSNYGKIYTSAKVTDKEVAVNLAQFVPAA